MCATLRFAPAAFVMRVLDFSGPDGDLYRLAHVADGVDAVGGWTRVDVGEATRAVRDAMNRPGAAQRLADFWSTLRAPGAWIDRSIAPGDAIAWADRELSRPAGVLALWRLPRPRPAIDAAAPDVPAELSDLAGSEPAEEQTWVAFRLLDLHGEPIPDVQYELTLADGSVQEGATDANGEARHEGIVRGSCVLVFPDLPETYWEQAHNAAE